MKEKFESLKKYNFWGEKYPTIGYKRDLYTNKIFESIDNRLIKVLIGQRRVGKSYILRQLISRLIDRGVIKKTYFILIRSLLISILSKIIKILISL